MNTQYQNSCANVSPSVLQPATPVHQQFTRPDSPENSVRTNLEWITELRGDQGDDEQWEAHDALCTYLYTVALNALWTRKPSLRQLSQYTSYEIEALAEDFVQGFCYKLIKDDYALLDKYSRRGRFLAWAAQILRNMIFSEFRKRPWKETERLDEQSLVRRSDTAAPHKSVPDLIFQNNQLADLVEKALAKLSPKNQTIFLRYIVDGERANVVAKELGITTSGVYTAAHRIRDNIGEQLLKAGYAQ